MSSLKAGLQEGSQSVCGPAALSGFRVLFGIIVLRIKGKSVKAMGDGCVFRVDLANFPTKQVHRAEKGGADDVSGAQQVKIMAFDGAG
jgi:hypothetical protein